MDRWRSVLRAVRRSQRVGLSFRVEHGVWHVNFLDVRSRMTIVPTWRVKDPDTRKKNELTEMDRLTGDGDLGTSMGCTAKAVQGAVVRIL
jgi:hypothetical protein